MEPLFSTTQPILLAAKRREIVFLLIAGLFLGTFALLNVLGLTRMLDFSFSIGNLQIPVIIPLGVLPYPITFICTDLITEFYGKERAKMVIWMGVAVNIWIAFILWVSAYIPPHVTLDPTTHLPAFNDPNFSFFQIRLYTISGIVGSMIAYLIAQLLDVNIFQWCKNLTKGKHLWFRSNTSTLLSQFIDTIIITSFAFFFTDAMAHLHQAEKPFSVLFTIVLSGYLFKALATMLSTIPFYCIVYFLRGYFDVSNKAITLHPQRSLG